MLTPKTKEALLFVNEYIEKNEIGPTVAEIQTMCGLRSKSSVHRLLSMLEERGFIRRLKGRARAIEVLRRPLLPGGRPSTPGTAPCRPTSASWCTKR